MKLTLIPNQNSAYMRRCATPKTGMDRIYEMVDLITDGSDWASVHIDFLDIGPARDDPAKLAWKANVYDRLRCGETVELDMAMPDPGGTP